MRWTIMLVATTLLFAGCGGEKGDSETQKTASSDGQPAPADGGESGGPEVRTVAEANAMMPNKKLGQWRMTSATNGQEMPEFTECVTEQNKVLDANLHGGTCADFRARKAGDAIVMTAICEAPVGEMTMETWIAGDFQNSYSVETTIRNPPNTAAPLTEVKATGTYVGPTCS